MGYASVENRALLYIPPWCAHGFGVLSEEAEVVYKVTQEYAPQLEAGIIWNDFELGIEWPVSDPVLSAKDESWGAFRDLSEHFVYERPA